MNTYYLGIDLNLPQDIKIIKLKRKLGFSGFGLYIELQLKLAQSKGYELSKNDYSDLAYEFRIEEKYLQGLVENFGLFEFKNDKFFIQEIRDKMQLIESKKEAGRKAGIASGKARNKGKPTSVERSLEQSLNNKGNKGKKIKEINKEIIEGFFKTDLKKIINKNIIPDWNQVWNEPQARATLENTKETMIEYYEKKQIKNIKLTFINWIKKYKKTDFYKFFNNPTGQTSYTDKKETKSIFRQDLMEFHYYQNDYWEYPEEEKETLELAKKNNYKIIHKS
jgi:Domain of unknown function (DUF4373)